MDAIALVLVSILWPTQASVVVPQNVQERVIRRLPNVGNARGRDEIDLKRIRTTVIPASVEPLIADLADDAWSARETATHRLRMLEVSDEALMRVLDQWSLTSEQRHRILNVLDYRITTRKRGALGIRMTPNNVQGLDGIVVTDLIPGLPAKRVLRVNDVIRRIDGKAIRINDDLITHVQKLAPGHRIEVEVLRPLRDEQPDPADEGGLVVGPKGERFEVVEVEFALGSYDKLGDDPRVSNPETNRRRLQVRRVREQWAAPTRPAIPAPSVPGERP